MDAITTTPSKPHRLISPIDVSKVKDENGVKKLVKELLDFHGWFHWHNGAGGFSYPGEHDRHALKNGVFLSVESKFDKRPATTKQKQFAAQVVANHAFAFCVNEKTIDRFAEWLESFDISVEHQLQMLPVPPEHGSRMLNAIDILTDPFAE